MNDENADPITELRDEAIEEVARAMSDADDGALLASGVGPIPWDTLCESDRESYRDYAKAALAYVIPRIAAEAREVGSASALSRLGRELDAIVARFPEANR